MAIKSFGIVVDKRDLTEENLDAIRNHIRYALNHNLFGNIDEDDSWEINETADYFYLDSSMGNFNMYSFLTKIGIKDNIVSSLSSSITKMK